MAQKVLEARRAQESEAKETPAEREARFARRAPDGETPDQRTNRFLEKARRAGYTSDTPMAPRNDIKDGISRLFNPEWAQDVGRKAGEALRGTAVGDKASAMARKYLDWVAEKQAQNKPVPIVQKYNEHAYPNARQDAELQVQREQIGEARRKLMEPRDLGEIDEEPQPRKK